MTSNWPTCLLCEVADEITVGYVGPMVNEYTDDGIPFLRSLNVEPFKINDNNIKYITKEFHQKIKKSALKPGDVVIVRTGKPGACTVIPDELKDANCSDLVIIRPGPNLDPFFLMYYVNTVASHHVSSHTVGAVQQHFNVASARQMELLLPSLPAQQHIARVFGSLDDKIELNRQMNETLEAMARAIFKSWFVDFDPVRAKAEGRDTGLPADISALFPDGFEMIDGREVPRKWGIGSIYEIADVIYGAPFSSKLFNTDKRGLPLIRIRDLSTQDPEIFTDEDQPRGEKIKPGDIVVGMDGEFKIHVWTGPISWLNQRVCKFAPKNTNSTLFLKYSILDPVNFFERSKVGTTIIHLGKSDIDTFRILIPSKEILAKFGEITEPISQKIVANAIESRTLAQIRDALLPKLMSGEIRVVEEKQ